jgi:hypothetical protein
MAVGVSNGRSRTVWRKYRNTTKRVILGPREGGCVQRKATLVLSCERENLTKGRPPCTIPRYHHVEIIARATRDPMGGAKTCTADPRRTGPISKLDDNVVARRFRRSHTGGLVHLGESKRATAIGQAEGKLNTQEDGVELQLQPRVVFQARCMDGVRDVRDLGGQELWVGELTWQSIQGRKVTHPPGFSIEMGRWGDGMMWRQGMSIS